jgi:hypothetical protein
VDLEALSDLAADIQERIEGRQRVLKYQANSKAVERFEFPGAQLAQRGSGDFEAL